MTRLNLAGGVAMVLAALYTTAIAQENQNKNQGNPPANAPQASGQQQNNSGNPSNSTSGQNRSSSSNNASSNGQSSGSSNDQQTNNEQASNSDQGAPSTSSKTNGSKDDSQSSQDNSTKNDKSANDKNASRERESNAAKSDSKRRDRDRSLLTNRDEDDSNERPANARNSAAESRDNERASAHHESRRDFRNDFKFGRTSSRGLAINTIEHNSIFYRSGLRDGDVLVSYGGRPIRSEDDFYRVAVYQPDQRVPVVVWRDGHEQTIYVVYEENDSADVAVSATSGRNLLGAEFDPQSSDGAVVIRVQKGSPAQRAGLMQNDVVIALNGDQVNSGREAMKIVEGLRAGDRLDIEFTRHARAQAVLGNNTNTRDVERTGYQSDDRRADVAVDVGTDNTRAARADRDRGNNNYQDRDRSDTRRDNRGILPRLRN